MNNKKLIIATIVGLSAVATYLYFKNKSAVTKLDSEKAVVAEQQKQAEEILVETNSPQRIESLALVEAIKKIDEIIPKMRTNIKYIKEYKSIVAPFGINATIIATKGGISMNPKHNEIVSKLTNKINLNGYNLLSDYQIEKIK